MCSLCQEEYDDPRNRRFHAQPNCCDACGPQIELVESREFRVKSKGGDAIIEAVQLLRAGKAVAIKGIGGFHLACDATNFSAVNTLRSRKYREDKPFALMARNITVIKSFCYVSEEEEKLLLSIRRPIVLLRKKEPSLITEHKLQIADGVAPKQKYYGVMLPYTPLHHLLLNNSGLILVMTSGNVSDEPISYTNEEAFTRLKSIADYFLWHDREIYIRCDDSVTRCFEDKEILVRRARGYVPEPIELPFRLRNHILACGAELKNTFCLARDNYAFISQHIGDLENLETLTSFEKGIEHFKNLFSISPSIIAYDLHPEYLSTKYAQKLKTQNSKLKTVGIQHHHAHIASCMAENNIEDKVIGVAFDGLGYGIDGAFWGGEFIVADFSEFIRVAYLEYVSMPGGTKAIKEPYRMAISYLYKSYGNEILDLEIEFINRIPKKQLQLLTNVISNKLNSPLTSSVGRLFDAVSSLLGICDKVNYEGQSAIELEMAIKVKSQKSKVKSYGYTVIKEDEVFIVDPKQIIMGIIEDLKKAIPVGVISFKLHNTIVEIIVNICKRIHNITGLNKVVLSGGVFQNMFLLSNAVNRLRVEGFEVYTHHKVPTNDGGISLGQVAIAAHREELCV
jgi:hydrogenase maturation protein HypF